MGRSRWLTAAIVAAAGASLGIAAAGDLGWRWESPLPPAVDLRDLIVADGRLLAVGDNGVVVSSADGLVWTVEGAATSASLTGVAWGDGVAVAVGQELVSTEPYRWDVVVVASRDRGPWREVFRTGRGGPGWYGVAWGAGRFVVVEGWTRLLTSVDGMSWQTIEDAFGDDVSAVAWNGTTFLALGLRGTYLSEDGVTWRAGARPPWHVEFEATPFLRARRLDVGWDGRQFVAFVADTLSTSDDGESWSEEKWYGDTAAPECLGLRTPTILASGSTWPEGGDPAYPWLEISVDGGRTWSESSQYGDVTTLAEGLQGLEWAGSEWIGVGYAGTVLLSDDGINWSCPQGGQCLGEEWRFWDAVEGPAGLVATGKSAWYLPQGFWLPLHMDGDVLIARRSPDGTWTSHALPSAGTVALSHLASNGQRYVGVGGTNAAVSEDGSTWTFVDDVSEASLHDVTWGHGLFVAVGEQGTVATSADGSVWSIGSADVAGDLRLVLSTLEGFLALGAEGKVLRSDDASHWDVLTTTADGKSHPMAEGGGRLVAVGGGGLLQTYTDAEGWVDRVAPLQGAGTELGSIAWDGTRFAVVGYRRIYGSSGYDYRDESLTLASRDGIHWTLLPDLGPAPDAAHLGRVRATSAGFVALGWRRTLVEATDLGTLVELDPPVGRIPLNQPATLTVAIDQARDEPTEVLLGASSGAIEVPRQVTIPAGATWVKVPIRGRQIKAGVEIRAELPDTIGGGVAISRLSVETMGPRRPGGRRAAPAGETERGVSRPDPR